MHSENVIEYLQVQGEMRQQAVTERDGALDVNQALRRLRLEHLARLIDKAGEIAEVFGLEIAIGFLYYEVLGRPPDPSGFSHYVAATGERQLTFSDIVAGMVGSEEFVNRFPYMRQSN
jgi:hypothetical protein